MVEFANNFIAKSQTVVPFLATLPKKFVSVYKKHPEKHLPSIFEETFLSIDKQLKLVGSHQNGCTGCVAFVEIGFGGKTTLHVANLGDTRCVLSKKGKACRLSRDHKPTEPDEQKRILAAGGIIKNGRVQGSLAVSRAFGDFLYKARGVIATPEVDKYEIGEEDQFIVIATDGLWDVVDD